MRSGNAALSKGADLVRRQRQRLGEVALPLHQKGQQEETIATRRSVSAAVPMKQETVQTHRLPAIGAIEYAQLAR